ncbi:MAG: radical SAM protein [Nanoarchaeota archaeon]|nr:radical SAM protein [Nanoarchaeota archaeon]
MKQYPDLPVKFPNKVPFDFINDLDGWSLSRDEVKRSKGRLLHLDIDFGTDCSLNCPMCFRKDGALDKFKTYLDLNKIKKVVSEAKPLGLKSVRVLGAGEPFENKGIFNFLYWLQDEGIKSVVFTQGHTINRLNATKLKKTNTSLMIRYDSFYEKIVEQSTGRKNLKAKKDLALEILVKKGFVDHNPTHLAIVAPITKYTISGLFEIYTFFRERNIYPLIPFLACAGRSLLPDGSIKDDVSETEKIELVSKIYKYNKEKGIIYDGISSYPGTHICTLLSNGFYLTSTGLALRCEGDDKTIIGDLKKQSIKHLWENSTNCRKYGKVYNYGCPPKIGKTIPKGFYKNVEDELKKSNLKS